MAARGTRSMLTAAFDAVVSIWSPKRAWTRRHFRRLDSDPDYRARAEMALGSRGYRSAKAEGTVSGASWFSQFSKSADAEILTDLPTLRAHARELNRDDPLASGLTLTFETNVIGTGIRPQARTGDTEKNEKIEAVWRERKDMLDPVNGLKFADLEALLFRKVIEDGDVFLKPVYPKYERMFFEVIEADRVTTPLSLGAKDIRDGVEKDKFGRPKAYHVLREHPGDNTLSLAKDFVTIPATRDDGTALVVHLRRVGRPGQTRGVPLFSAIQGDLRDLDLLLLASVKRVQIAACLSVFLESPLGVEEALEVTAAKKGYKLDQKIEPGMIYKLAPEERISTLVPNFPTPELESFIIMLCRRIGAAVGVSWQVVLRDFSQSTYSSARTDSLDTRKGYVKWQQWFIENVLNWVWARVMEEAQLVGDPRLRGMTQEDLTAVQWIANGWEWVDPKKEADAIEKKLALGITTKRDVCASMPGGQDAEETMKQWLREELAWHEGRESIGLPPAPYPIALILQPSAKAESEAEPEGDEDKKDSSNADKDE